MKKVLKLVSCEVRNWTMDEGDRVIYTEMNKKINCMVDDEIWDEVSIQIWEKMLNTLNKNLRI